MAVRQPNKLVLLSVILSWPALSLAACPANLAGKTAHWAVAVCEARTGTDDFESPAVQSCITAALADHKIDANRPPDCSNNKSLKKEWCEYLANNGSRINATECMKSTKTIPRVVSTDGV